MTDRRRPYAPKRTTPLAPDERQSLAIDKRLVLRLKREALNQEIDSDGDLTVSLRDLVEPALVTYLEQAEAQRAQRSADHSHSAWLWADDTPLSSPIDTRTISVSRTMMRRLGTEAALLQADRGVTRAEVSVRLIAERVLGRYLDVVETRRAAAAGPG
jgi:hypothetical protein